MKKSECEKGYKRWISPTSGKPTIDEMTKALADAGWKRSHGTAFTRPDGAMFRGPAMAYHVLMGLRWPPPQTPL